MTKTYWIALVVIVLLVIAGGWYYYSTQNNGYQAPAPQPGNSSSSAPVAGPGGHCGGNMTTAATCGAGYTCAPDPNSHLPFGDVGGICVQVQAQSSY